MYMNYIYTFVICQFAVKSWLDVEGTLFGNSVISTYYVDEE